MMIPHRSRLLALVAIMASLLLESTSSYLNVQSSSHNQQQKQQYYSAKNKRGRRHNNSFLWRLQYHPDPANGKQDTTVVQKLQKEKLDLQNDFEMYKMEQRKRQDKWERKVQELTQKVQQLQKQQQQQQQNSAATTATSPPVVIPSTVSLTKSTAPTITSLSSSTVVKQNDQRREQLLELREQEWAHQVEDLRRQVAQLQHQLAAKEALLAELPPDVVDLQQSYSTQLAEMQQKHEAEAKLAEERLMQWQIHNQKFQQGIKDQAAGRQERLKIDYDAKLDRKSNELAKTKVLLVQAQERIQGLEATVVDMHQNQQSLRTLLKAGLNLLKVRLLRRFQRPFQVKQRKKTKRTTRSKNSTTRGDNGGGDDTTAVAAMAK